MVTGWYNSSDSFKVVSWKFLLFFCFADADTPKIEGDNKKIAVGENLSLMCMGNSKPKPMDTYWEKGGGIASDSGMKFTYVWYLKD